MTQPDNAAVVTQAYGNFKSGNLEALFAQMDPGIEWSLPVIPNVRLSGQHHGVAGVQKFFQMLGEDQEVITFEPRELIANADKVVALGQYTWTVRSTGKQIGSDFAHVFTIRNGRITGFQEFTDSGAFAEGYRS